MDSCIKANYYISSQSDEDGGEDKSSKKIKSDTDLPDGIKMDSCIKANYYISSQSDEDGGEDKSRKKIKSDTDLPDVTHLLLTRRYSLTSSSYKYLEIGIAVGPPPIVQWIIGGNQGNKISFYFDTWSGLMEKQTVIENMSQNEGPRSLKIHDLTISTCFMYGSKMYKLTCDGKTLMLKPKTMKYLFKLRDCIRALYNDFIDTTCSVSVKFTQFVKVLQAKGIVDVEQAEVAIRCCDHFSPQDLVDCELLACALPDIIKKAKKQLMMASNVSN